MAVPWRAPPLPFICHTRFIFVSFAPKKRANCRAAVAGVVFAGGFLFSFWLNGGAPLTFGQALLITTAFICWGFFGYMSYARKWLSYEGGGIQGKLLDNLLGYLDWNGEGSLLDVGCGSGAMAVKAARKFPSARITGIDYWGFGWDYSKKQCENNALFEGVGDRVTFQKGDAAKLGFPDAAFDAVVSNLVFHEVRSQPDKLALMREVLRVVKPGGAFAFEDIFFFKRFYKNIDAIIYELSGEVSQIHFVDMRSGNLVPACLKTPPVLWNIGLIYGKKQRREAVPR